MSACGNTTGGSWSGSEAGLPESGYGPLKSDDEDRLSVGGLTRHHGSEHAKRCRCSSADRGRSGSESSESSGNSGSTGKSTSRSESRSSSGSSSGIMAAHEGDSNQHARLSRPPAQATAGKAMDLDGFSTAAGAVASPGATMHGPAAEALLEGAKYGAETEDVAGSSDAAAAARMRPPRPVDLAANGAAGAAEDGQMGSTSAAAAATVTGERRKMDRELR